MRQLSSHIYYTILKGTPGQNLRFCNLYGTGCHICRQGFSGHVHALMRSSVMRQVHIPDKN